MAWQDDERKMNEAIKRGDWDKAIEHAKAMPATVDPFQKMPHQNMPTDAMHKVVDYLSSLPDNYSHGQNKSSFAYEMAQNLPTDADNDLLHKLYHLYPHDEINNPLIFNHPNFKYEGKDARLKAAQDFFHDYEIKVGPRHFATVKSMFTGKPEEIIDHRGNRGISEYEIVPHIREHAKEIQKKLKDDPNIAKKYFGSEPHILLYRGVNGTYGDIIRKKANYNPKTQTVKKKTFTIPTAHMTSWTTDPEWASRFVWGRSDIPGQPSNAGVVMAQWVPLKDILHSSMHNSVAGPKSKQTDESEIIVGHPEGKMKISTYEMHFQPEVNESNYGKVLKPTLTKSDIYPLEEVLLKNTVRNTIAAATVASMMGSPIHPDSDLKLKDIQYNPSSVFKMQNEKYAKIDPDLESIKMIESSGGKNLIHKPVTTGLNAGTSAYGKYGLMPLQMIETAKLDPHIRAVHPEFLKFHYLHDQDKIKEYVSSHPGMEDQLANSHWKRLNRKFEGDKSKMAYAWINGVTGTIKASPDEIKNSDYVKKFNQYQALKKLQHFKKNEVASLGGNTLKSFDAIQNKKEDGSDVYKINQLLQQGQTHDLSNSGHFTHSSFVVGFDKDNSWLIKIDQHERSSIEAIKYGLQSVKESAFYNMAKDVFGLANFTPKAILGELYVGEHKKTCVAIKMFPDVYIPAVDLNKQDHSEMFKVVNQYVADGTLHKLSAMMWILGDMDGHGHNILTNGQDMKLIDHGGSFADNTMDVKDKDAYIPYFMRVWGNVTDNMGDEEKLLHMPKVDNKEVNDELQHWLFGLDIYKVIEILNNYKLGNAAAVRLQALRQMIDKRPDTNISFILNECWVKPWFKMKQEEV